MRDYVSIGCTPFGEDCEQLGREYRPEIAIAECKAFVNQIRRVLGEEPEGARLRTVSHAHDFGTYHEVECVYYVDNENAQDYAYDCESSDLLEYWDDEARKELSNIPGYPIDRLLVDDINFDHCSYSDTV